MTACGPLRHLVQREPNVGVQAQGVNFCIPNQMKKATIDHRKNAEILGAQWTLLFIEAFNELRHRVLGLSPGFVPRGILSTQSAARR